jgi:hypothetical protein
MATYPIRGKFGKEWNKEGPVYSVVFIKLGEEQS